MTRRRQRQKSTTTICTRETKKYQRKTPNSKSSTPPPVAAPNNLHHYNRDTGNNRRESCEASKPELTRHPRIALRPLPISQQKSVLRGIPNPCGRYVVVTNRPVAKVACFTDCKHIPLPRRRTKTKNQNQSKPHQITPNPDQTRPNEAGFCFRRERDKLPRMPDVCHTQQTDTPPRPLLSLRLLPAQNPTLTLGTPLTRSRLKSRQG